MLCRWDNRKDPRAAELAFLAPSAGEGLLIGKEGVFYEMKNNEKKKEDEFD